jgi:hypothetical protein
MSPRSRVRPPVAALVSLALAALVVAAAAWDIARVGAEAGRARDAEVALLRAQVVSHQENTLQWRGLAASDRVDAQIALLSGRAQQLQLRLRQAQAGRHGDRSVAGVVQAAAAYELELEILFGRAPPGRRRARCPRRRPPPRGRPARARRARRRAAARASAGTCPDHRHSGALLDRRVSRAGSGGPSPA